MPALSPFEVISISAGLAVNSFGIFKVLFEKGFQKRYAKFEKAFHNWLSAEISKFLGSLQVKVSQKVTPSEVIEDLRSWVEKQASVLDVNIDYELLDISSNWIIRVLGASVLFGFFGLIFPLRINAVNPDPTQDRPLFWADFGTAMLALGVFLIFRYIWNFQKLSRRMTGVECGTPFEKIFEEQLSEESE